MNTYSLSLSHFTKLQTFVVLMHADEVRVDSSLFQLIEAYTQVSHEGWIVLSSSRRPSRHCVHRGGYRHKITTPAPALAGGGGAYGPAYITVTVGNRIHQIKSSIYLCGSGDSGGGLEGEGGGVEVAQGCENNPDPVVVVEGRFLRLRGPGCQCPGGRRWPGHPWSLVVESTASFPPLHSQQCEHYEWRINPHLRLCAYLLMSIH